MKRLLAGIIIIGISGAGSAFASDCIAMNKPYPVYNQGVSLKNSIVTVPAGISFKGVFLAPVSSSYAYTGQEITLALSRDFYYNNNLIAPVGSTVTGTVIEADRAKHGAIDGKLSMRFTHIITPSGADIPISAVVKTIDSTGILYGNMKLNVSSEPDLEASIEEGNELVRTIAPPYVYSAAKGNTFMPAIGSGGGLVKSIWDKGSEVDIPVNSSIDLILIQPITTDLSSYEN